MAVKLTLIALAVMAIVMITAERLFSSNQRTGFMRFLQRRDCIGKCQTNCAGSDSNCCIYPGTKQHGKCQRVPETYWVIDLHQCNHPDLHYNQKGELVNDECGDINVPRD